MFSGEQKEKEAVSGPPDKKFKDLMKYKGKAMRRAENAFSRLSDAEKYFVNAYINDPDMSYGAAVVKCGLADSMEDAVSIGIALLKNPRIEQAVEEIRQLGGITPSKIKQGILKIAETTDDPNVALSAWKTLGKYQGMEVFTVKHVKEDSVTDSEEIKKRLSATMNDMVVEAESYINALKMQHIEQQNSKNNVEYETTEEIVEDVEYRIEDENAGNAD